MKLFQNNIWTLFFIVAFLSTALFAGAIYSKDAAFLEQNRNEQLNFIKIFENNFLTQLTEQEHLLDLISDQYLHKGRIDKQQVDVLLSRNKLLANLKLISPAGKPLFSSRHLRYAEELSTDDAEKNKWFQQAKETTRMIVGKPYLSTSLSANNIWIIPLAKQVLNKKKKVVAVICAGLNLANMEKLWQGDNKYQSSFRVNLDETFSTILSTEKQPAASTTLLTLDYVYFKYQLQIANKQAIPDIVKRDKHNYLPLLSEKVFATTLADSAAKKENKLDELRNSEKPYQITIESQQLKKSLYTLAFNKKYHLWFSVQTDYGLFKKSLHQAGFYYFTAYLFLMAVLFSLFGWIANLEKEKIREISFKAQHDALTGLYNRSELEAQFKEAILQKNIQLSLLYLDLGNVKNINDSFGYSYGDLILKEITRRIVRSLKELPGTAFRHHGDEFAILIRSGDRELIEKYVIKLLQFISFPYLIHNNQFQVKSAIGIASYPTHADNIESLLTYAEKSTHRAKETKQCYTFFSIEEHHRLMRKFEIEQALKKAINNQEISLVYQPQIDCNQRLCGVEALVRWHSNKLGFIAPDQFIPIAEETNLMPELGYYILCRALREISTLQEKEKISFTLSVNVSVKQFMQVDFLSKLLQACHDYKDNNLVLILEITESLFIENIEALLPTFNKLKEHNILLSLDDFGTGYSSLSMLRQVPINELKIDKSFVDHITDNESDHIMLASIINMGKKLNMTVLTEGVETREQVELLKMAHCDLFQGYYFSKPLTYDALAEFVKNNATAKESTFQPSLQFN